MEDKKRPTMKKAVVMSVMGVILFFAAFLSIACAAIMYGSGTSETTIKWIVLIGFFGGNAASVFLIARAYPTLLLHDCLKMDKNYDKRELSRLYLPDQTYLTEKLSAYKFRYMKEGYYRKKEFSLSKDMICYLLRVTEDSDIENAFRREIARLERMQVKWKNLCLILFVYMDRFEEYEKETLKNLSKVNIVTQTLINPKISASAMIVVVDRKNNAGYFLDTAKNNFSLYAKGCKLVKKLFGQHMNTEIV